MGKKKPFIDKKTASVYHVVRRSQRDVGTEATAETLSDFVLMADPENEKRAEIRRRQDERENHTRRPDKAKGPVDFTALKSHLSAAGLLDETATTYSKYTKPISGSGVFITVDESSSEHLGALLTDSSKNNLDTALQEAMAIHEVGRMLDSIALTADCMEEDVSRALFEDYEEGEYEEILDDFCLTANMEPEETGGGASGASGEFNFDEHIRLLMEKARMKENGGGEGRELEDDFFGGITPLHARIEEEEECDDFDYEKYGEEEDSLDREFSGTGENYAKPMNDEQQRILCQKFEEALLEYDSDDVGDLDDECEEIVGSRPLEGDAQLEAALDEFLTEKEDEILIEGNKHLNQKRTGGSGYSALVGKTMVHASQLSGDDDPSKTLLINIEESKKQMQKDLADADAILANPEMDLPPEEILIDGKSYFSETSRNPWDCESILSTYSNLDNNPVVIGRSSRRNKKKGKKKESMDVESQVIPEDKPVKIQLSNKTGLPLGVFDKPNHNSSGSSPEDDFYGESDTYISVNKGESRNKAESTLEKKVRKMAVKEERKICRIQKKIMKEAFREEFQKRGSAEVVDAVGGTTVFRFS
ncbi:hypothetical protein HJC23_007483 [Cyclotella cryptica]|uniref:Protein LTV1 homolog n=1 Tax=Cyclotella cryptica TaxID=29204 RepID=A0ABD3NUF7_9STRA|eukprot:CCRYP_019695-RA/>CCRYP_019695-RA protein AED:0.00 eAED:0.00 QI:271/-1/1/1/-1/1/1/145/589